MRKKEPGAFALLLVVMFLAPVILNFSYGAYRNYKNARLAQYLDLNNFTVYLNEDITKGQLEKCLAEFSGELEYAISDIILDAELPEGKVCCRFIYRDGRYGRAEGHQNLLVNNFVTAYFTEEQEEQGLPVALAPADGEQYSWQEEQERKVILQGREYEIIGYQSWDSFYMLPYASLDDETRLSKEEGITIYFREAVTQAQYKEIAAAMKRIFGERVTIPEIEFTDMQKDGLNRTILIILVLLAAVFSGNICILLNYIREKLGREHRIFYICGMTRKRILVMELGSVLLLSIPQYAVGNLIYAIVIGQNAQKWMGHLSKSMVEKAYPQIFILYICFLFLFVLVKTGRTMCLDRKKGRK